MNQFKQYCNNIFNQPIWLLVLLWLGMVITNYQANTWLVGWDNTMPELNFGAAWNKEFYAVWQEHRGLGLLDGMAHGANLIHLALLWLLDWFSPTNWLRYMFTLGMHLMGGIGVYCLALQLLPRQASDRWIATIAGLFYLFNWGTMQMFYAPLEVFTMHYAMLPWLVWSLLRVLRHFNRRNLLLWLGLNLLATPQAHVPSVFIAYALVVGIWLTWHIGQATNKIQALKQAVIIVGFLIAANAFWAFPYAYSVFHNAPIITNSKINQLSNPEIVLRNQAFGNLESVALLKGFNLGYPDMVEPGKHALMMQPWVEWMNQWWVSTIGWLWFGLVSIGLGLVVYWREKQWYPVAILFVVSFLLLGTDIPILSLFSKTLHLVVPFFAAVFRYAFTKFILIYALAGSLLLAYSLSVLYPHLTRILKNLVITTIIGLLVVYTWPTWQGQFLYPRLRLQIPEAYFQSFAFFRQQPKDQRIAVLPSPSFWGWTSNEWGFRGSGFTWYGIEQPTMDRAFDPWSHENEQYYWELSRAIQTGNTELLGKVLAKYDITWILLDDSILNTVTYSEDHDQLEELLSKLDGYTLAAEFDFIKVYKRTDNQTSWVKQFSNLPIIHNPFAFSWEDQAYQDYGDYISYSNLDTQSRRLTRRVENDSLEGTPTTNYQQLTTIYPFPSLFTNRLQSDIEVKIIERDRDIVLIAPNLNDSSLDTQTWQVHLPNMVTTYDRLPLRVESTLQADQVLAVTIWLDSPTMLIGDQIIHSSIPLEFELDASPCFDAGESCFLSLGYQQEVELDLQNMNQVETQVTVDAKLPTIVGLRNNRDREIDLFDFVEIDWQMLNSRFQPPAQVVEYSPSDSIQVSIYKISSEPFGKNYIAMVPQNSPAKTCREDSYGKFEKNVESLDSNKIITYSATGTSSCDHFYIENLPHSQGYLFRLDTQNVQSIPFKVGIQNPSAERSELDSLLWDSPDWQENWLIVPPTDRFDKGYTVFLDTPSFGREENINRINNLQVWPLPYNWLKQIRIQDSGLGIQDNQVIDLTDRIKVEKKAIWLYKVSLPKSHDLQPTTLTLSQAYHSGWLAYAPGYGLLEHLKVNNWANGWEVNRLKAKSEKLNGEELNQANPSITTSYQQPNTIYIFFWPQLVELLGFGLLGGVALYFILPARRNRASHNRL